MNEKSVIEDYLVYLNENILPFIDYDKLHESYRTDLVYAKGILNHLHEAMVKVYGSEHLDWQDGDDGYVIIPGVLRGSKSGNICVALFELDLNSSGEHSGTDYLCKYGIVSQARTEVQDDRLTGLVNRFYAPYDYCYTADVECDHHVEYDKLPKELKSVLNSFHKFKAELSFPPDMPDESGKKPSLLEGVREAGKEVREQNQDKSDKKKEKPEL